MYCSVRWTRMKKKACNRLVFRLFHTHKNKDHSSGTICLSNRAGRTRFAGPIGRPGDRKSWEYTDYFQIGLRKAYSKVLLLSLPNHVA